MVKITIQEIDDSLVAVMDGRFDTPSSAKARTDLEPLFHCDDKDVIFDCTDLVYIASSGLRILLEILDHVKSHGNHVYMKGISGTIKEAFKMTGFINIFEFI